MYFNNFYIDMNYVTLHENSVRHIKKHTNCLSNTIWKKNPLALYKLILATEKIKCGSESGRKVTKNITNS